MVKKVVLSVFLGSIALVFVAFFIAFVELNVIAFFLQSNPNIIGVVQDRKQIAKLLKANNMFPQIVSTDSQHVSFSLARAMSGPDNFFGKYIVSAIPQSFVLPVDSQKTTMLLLDNTLIITTPTDADLQVISPVIGYILIKHYFPNRKIKSDPNISIMTKKEYTAFREQEENKKVSELENQAKELLSAEKRIADEIDHDKQMIAANESIIAQTQSLKGTYRDARRLASKNRNDWSAKLLRDQLVYKEYLSYDILLKQQKEGVAMQKGTIAYENGVFEPKDSIKLLYKLDEDGLVMAQKQDQGLTNYFEILVHEYLHYSSFISSDKQLKSSFFEESLTEYFARQVIKEGMHSETNVAYPVQVKLIEQMMQKIPEGDLAEIYFMKDQEQLEKTLDNTYGDGFYRNNEVLFEALQYITNKQQLLLVANVIMKKIGGEPIKNF
jgi:hypothetical protein